MAAPRPAPILLDDIPGLTESVRAAQHEEEQLRDIAFAGIPDQIAGIDAEPFAPIHFLRLQLARSPFICGGEPDGTHVAAFLWAVSPCFTFDRDARDAFVARLAQRDYDSDCEAIDDYLDRAFADAPGGGSREPSPITSFAAVIVHEIAHAYGWPLGEILRTPFAILFQLLRLIAREHNPRATFINRRSDRVRREHVERHLASLASTPPPDTPAPQT